MCFIYKWSVPMSFEQRNQLGPLNMQILRAKYLVPQKGPKMTFLINVELTVLSFSYCALLWASL